MFELKPITKEAIPRAIEKAERYRLLNEPAEAESICLDVLKVEPENQKALITLLLALTDQFDQGLPSSKAEELLPRIKGEYDRTYYRGIIFERHAKAHLKPEAKASRFMAYDWFCNAMKCFEKAESMQPPGNDDAQLRWNACARILESHPDIVPEKERIEPPLE